MVQAFASGDVRNDSVQAIIVEREASGLSEVGRRLHNVVWYDIATHNDASIWNVLQRDTQHPEQFKPFQTLGLPPPTQSFRSHQLYKNGLLDPGLRCSQLLVKFREAYDDIMEIRGINEHAVILFLVKGRNKLLTHNNQPRRQRDVHVAFVALLKSFKCPCCAVERVLPTHFTQRNRQTMSNRK